MSHESVTARNDSEESSASESDREHREPGDDSHKDMAVTPVKKAKRVSISKGMGNRIFLDSEGACTCLLWNAVNARTGNRFTWHMVVAATYAAQ
jgi:hypothetical protein